MLDSQIRTVLAEYETLAEAQNAVSDLTRSGVSSDAISLIVRDQGGDYAERLQVKDDNVTSDEGAGFGALIGLLTGVAFGIGALTIPGLGPVIAAGPLVGGIIGGAAGAVTGGITAALIKSGVPEEDAARYEAHLQRGGALVTVQTTDARAPQVEAILNRNYGG